MNPKFERKLKDRIVDPVIQSGNQPGYGMVLGYDRQNNTCMVIAAAPGSDRMGEIYKDVPCPVMLGVQGVSPTTGMYCWLAFKDGTQTFPYITNFFNHHYNKHSYTRQARAVSDTPSYMLDM